MQTVLRARSSVQHFGFESNGPLRQPEELAVTPNAAPTSGFRPVRPGPALFAKPPKNLPRVAKLRTASLSLTTQPNSGADALSGDEQRWCTGRDWYTTDDDNPGWF